MAQSTRLTFDQKKELFDDFVKALQNFGMIYTIKKNDTVTILDIAYSDIQVILISPSVFEQRNPNGEMSVVSNSKTLKVIEYYDDSVYLKSTLKCPYVE